MSTINGNNFNPGLYSMEQLKNRMTKIEGNVKTKDLVKDNDQDKRDKTLYQACQDFEAIFTQLVFKEMRNSVQKGGLVDKGFGEEVFESMLDEEIAKSSVKKDSSIADLLYQQLRLQLDQK